MPGYQPTSIIEALEHEVIEHYLLCWTVQGRIYNELGVTSQRNRCAAEFRQLDVQYPTWNAATTSQLWLTSFLPLGGLVVRASDLSSRDHELNPARCTVDFFTFSFLLLFTCAATWRNKGVYCWVAYVNSAFHPSGVGKSSTSLLSGVKAGQVYLCRVAGMIPYGRWRPVALYAALSFN